MRYNTFVINNTIEDIKANAKIRLKDYSFSSTLAALEQYIRKNIENDINFVPYREQNGKILVAYSYDERKVSDDDVSEMISKLLMDAFGYDKGVVNPQEITMCDFRDALDESIRRDYIDCGRNRVLEGAHLWIYYYYRDDIDKVYFIFEEGIISDDDECKYAIFDQGFLKEIENIKAHANAEGFSGNTVHYCLSAKSMEAVRSMASTITKPLFDAGRLSGKRIEYISEIDPRLSTKTNYFENIFENNFGGTVVIDLSVKFGHQPSEYVMTAKYLVKLFKKYRNNCLFIFTYDVNEPGFAYYVLPKLNKYAINVTLKEGTGNRKAALKYMKGLIKNSEYSQYANQAAEYMKYYPGDKFSQTDVLIAFEQFGPWCINKNILKAYDFDPQEGFKLERDEDDTKASEKLEKAVALDNVKRQINTVIASDITESERRKRKGSDYEPSSRGMIFAGDPGTCKSTVARLFAGIAKEKGVLSSGVFVERGGMDLDGPVCVGAIREAFTAAKGGVLFIDEAYSMGSQTAISTLVQEIENRRDETIVILAGYNERMKKWLELNEGLKSRLPHYIEFPNYTTEELTEIFISMASSRGFELKDDVIDKVSYILDKARRVDNFGNGRYVRNLLDKALLNQSPRVLGDRDSAENIKDSKLFELKPEDITPLEDGEVDVREPGTAAKELDEMVALKNVKEIIKKITNNCKLKKLCVKKGIKKDPATLHMVFTGNPGTAKTTVARLWAEIARDEQILATGNFVEVGRADLIGDHVGDTEKIVKQKFREAQGGVLFIDEAYALNDHHDGSYGDNALDTIIQLMENNREDTVFVFGGYPEPMEALLAKNPGMKSRIAFHVNFDDYSVDELCDITKLMLKQKSMSITDEAMDKLRGIYEKVCNQKDYGNGRFVRSIIEDAEMNIADRIADYDEADITKELITTIEACDIKNTDYKTDSNRVTLGFA